jgi:hypothetical protein
MQRRAFGRSHTTLPDQDQIQSAQERYAEEVASRAVALRAQVREWSNHPPQLDTRPE